MTNSDRLTQSQITQLSKILQELAGPVASQLIQVCLNDCQTLPQILAQIEVNLLESQKSVFRQRTHMLQAKVAVNHSFIEQCRQALLQYVGPIAPHIILTTLQQNQDLTEFEFVDALCDYVADPVNAAGFRELLLKPP